MSTPGIILPRAPGTDPWSDFFNQTARLAEWATRIYAVPPAYVVTSDAGPCVVVDFVQAFSRIDSPVVIVGPDPEDPDNGPFGSLTIINAPVTIQGDSLVTFESSTTVVFA